MDACLLCGEYRVLSGKDLCIELLTRPEDSIWLLCVVVCDLETHGGPQRHWGGGGVALEGIFGQEK